METTTKMMKRLILLAFIFIPLAAMAQRIEIYTDDNADRYYAMYAYGLPREIVKTNSEMRASVTSGGIVRRHHTTKGEDASIVGTSSSSEDGYNANRKISFAYAIAPYNVDASGSHTTSTDGISWIAASGWSTDIEDTISAYVSGDSGDGSGESTVASTPTGCAAYQGLSGKDPVGTWRLPTQREAQIMLTVVEQVLILNDTEGVEGQIEEGEIWTATELYAANDYWRAWFVNSVSSITHNLSRTSWNKKMARCVKDIYDPINE